MRPDKVAHLVKWLANKHKDPSYHLHKKLAAGLVRLDTPVSHNAIASFNYQLEQPRIT